MHATNQYLQLTLPFPSPPMSAGDLMAERAIAIINAHYSPYGAIAEPALISVLEAFPSIARKVRYYVLSRSCAATLELNTLDEIFTPDADYYLGISTRDIESGAERSSAQFAKYARGVCLLAYLTRDGESLDVPQLIQQFATEGMSIA